jgi:hypothetical protein
MMIASRAVSICYEHDFGALRGAVAKLDEPQQQG